MGAAAYNRGSEVIRRQADDTVRLISRRPVGMTWEQDKAVLVQRIADLEHDLSKARRSIASLRATLSVERANRTQEQERTERHWKEMVRWAFRMKRSWEFTSAIVRRYVTPEEVEEFRQEAR